MYSHHQSPATISHQSHYQSDINSSPIPGTHNPVKVVGKGESLGDTTDGAGVIKL